MDTVGSGNAPAYPLAALALDGLGDLGRCDRDALVRLATATVLVTPKTYHFVRAALIKSSWAWVYIYTASSLGPQMVALPSSIVAKAMSFMVGFLFGIIQTPNQRP